MIEDYLSKGSPVFEDELSKIKYEAAKETFTSYSKCPTEVELNNCKTLEEAISMIDTYYTYYFTDEYTKYIERLRLKLEPPKIIRLKF